MIRSLAFGEVLWDIFGTKREIGGAPFNFSAHISKLCCDACLVSAVGEDDLGSETLAMMDRFGVKRDFVGVTGYPTGRCLVVCDGDGQPRYELAEDTAWDHIAAGQNLLEQAAEGDFDLLYFGTLGVRSPESAGAFEDILRTGKFTHVFCDLNLRQNFYSRAVLGNSLGRCTILKLNREELQTLREEGFFKETASCGVPEYYRSACAQLARNYDISLILLTLDADGAVIFDRAAGEAFVSPKPRNRVVSAVGAGDSFSACFLANYLYGHPVELCTERAMLLSGYVVTQYGAVPEYPPELLRRIMPV